MNLIERIDTSIFLSATLGNSTVWNKTQPGSTDREPAEIWGSSHTALRELPTATSYSLHTLEMNLKLGFQKGN